MAFRPGTKAGDRMVAFDGMSSTASVFLRLRPPEGVLVRGAAPTRRRCVSSETQDAPTPRAGASHSVTGESTPNRRSSSTSRPPKTPPTRRSGEKNVRRPLQNPGVPEPRAYPAHAGRAAFEFRLWPDKRSACRRVTRRARHPQTGYSLEPRWSAAARAGAAPRPVAWRPMSRARRGNWRRRARPPKSIVYLRMTAAPSRVPPRTGCSPRPRDRGAHRRCRAVCASGPSRGIGAARRLIVAGVSGGSASHGGSLVMTNASVSVMSSPPKARRPASSSNSTQPNAQMSARRSTARPFACSGAM